MNGDAANLLGHVPMQHKHDDLHPIQIAAWKRMSPDEKWALAQQANRMLREAVRNRVRRQNPGFDEEKIEYATSRFLLSRGT